MPSFISDLWIFSKDGLPLIEVFNNDKINSTLLGAFLSAIESFSFKLSGTELKSINLGENKFILTSFLEGNVYLAIKCDLKVKNKKIERIFKIIIDYFEELYNAEDIKNWDGDITFFNKFKERIHLYFQMYDL